MYHSWWFQLLILLLTANIIVCSIDRMSANRRILFVKNPLFNLGKFRNLKQREKFADNRSADALKAACEDVVRRQFRFSKVETTDRGYAVFGEKGRWTRFGVYTVHFSVVLLLIGALIGSMFGFEGFVNIPEGESVSQIRLRNQPQMLQLDFTIRCDDYFESYYENGSPKEFRSSLTILEQGRPVYSKDIVVNDPLRYKGISIYQSSRGQLPSDEVVLAFTERETGKAFRKNAGLNQPIQLPDKRGTFELTEFQRAAQFRGNDIGEAFIGILTPPGKDPVAVTLPLRFPSFDKMRKGEYFIAVVEQVPKFYTGLQVAKDPGVWVVYSGFILMIIGCYITFFMSHQQICFEIAQNGKKTQVMVAGTANKNKSGMQVKVSRIAAKLAGREATAN
jgi:cytochrome c biogenesis protein